MRHRLGLAALLLSGCALGPDARCLDDDNHPVVCEELEDSPELPDDIEPPEDVAAIGGVDTAADFVAGPDDLDGLRDDAVAVAFADDAEASDLATLPNNGGPTGGSAIAWGRTHNAERRKFLPIGRTSGANRFVIMRLHPSDLPGLQLGDTLRAAAELQVTTSCDIGQVGPSCGYAPNVRLQLLLSGNANATDPSGPGTIALSDIVRFDCNADDHHCVKIINFHDASALLTGARAPGCVTDNSCFVNLVAWAYHPDARSGGKDKLLLGANEGDFLQNGKIEQDRGRLMAIRERDLTAADVALRVTSHNVRSGGIELASNGDEKRIYSHTLKGGADLKAGEKFRVWADVEASSNHRVNLSLEMFVTKNRVDHNGGHVDNTTPKAISEHNGTNCSPGNDCHLHKVALFEVDHDIAGPVYVNIAASTEVPGPGSATTTIHDSGYIKSVRYAR